MSTPVSIKYTVIHQNGKLQTQSIPHSKLLPFLSNKLLLYANYNLKLSVYRLEKYNSSNSQFNHFAYRFIKTNYLDTNQTDKDDTIQAYGPIFILSSI